MDLSPVYQTTAPQAPSLLDALLGSIRQRSPLLSLCGAGGKTSTLFWLAEHYQRRGLRVLISTTTRMFMPEASRYQHLTLEPDPARQLSACRAMPARAGIHALFSAWDPASDKVSGVLPEQLDAIKAAGLFDVILVEADGAHQRLLKVPAAHEPCIPSASDIVLALTGGAMIRAAASAGLIHRWEQFQALTGLQTGDIIDWPVLDRLLSHPEGIFKGTPARARRIWLINGVHSHETHGAPAIAQLLARHPEIEAIWQGAVQEAEAIHYLWSHQHG